MVTKKLGHEKLDGSKIDWYSVLETGTDVNFTDSSPVAGDVLYIPPTMKIGNVEMSTLKPKPLSAKGKKQALLRKEAREKKIDEVVASKMKE